MTANLASLVQVQTSRATELINCKMQIEINFPHCAKRFIVPFYSDSLENKAAKEESKKMFSLCILLQERYRLLKTKSPIKMYDSLLTFPAVRGTTRESSNMRFFATPDTNIFPVI